MHVPQCAESSETSLKLVAHHLKPMSLLHIANLVSTTSRRCTIRPNLLFACFNRNMAVNSVASDEAQPAAKILGHTLHENVHVDESKWDEMLQILGSLIAFKNRADALGWRDAFENMPVYLEVRAWTLLNSWLYGNKQQVCLSCK